jgi:hypothetical protein
MLEKSKYVANTQAAETRKTMLRSICVDIPKNE